MSGAAAIQNPLAIRLPRRSCCILIYRNRLEHRLFFNSLVPPTHVSHFRQLAPFQKKAHAIDTPRWRIEAFVSGEGFDGSPRRDVPGRLDVDAILSVSEALCIVPSIVYSIGSVLCLMLPGCAKLFPARLGNVFFVWQFFLLVGAVAIGSLIRHRQWHGICTYNGTDVDLIKRIEKVEENLRSSATILQVLSRQQEKLGIRFRITRKALKESITETAALAQRNSEVTRALAEQEDILEKELGEIQKVLLAMQEQQQKQLELILAIGKAGRLLEGNRGDRVANQGSVGKSGSVLEKSTSIHEKKDVNEIEIQIGQ